MARLSIMQRESLPEADRCFYDAVRAIRRRPISGPFITLLNSSPDLAARFAHLGHYFHARGQADESILPGRVRTFVALILARALNCPYEWSAWVGWAIEAGIAQATADAIREGRTPADLPAEDALVLDFCTQLLTGSHRVSDATYAAAHARYGAQGVVELSVTLGYFAMIAYPLNAFEIEMSAQQKGDRKPFAPLMCSDASSTAPTRSTVPAFEGPRTGAARIPLVTRVEDVRPEHQQFFDRVVRTRGRIAPPYQVLLASPDVAVRVADVGDFLVWRTVVPRAEKALAWLIAAREYDCGYEWAMAAREARAAAVSDDAIAAISRGEPPAGLTREQQCLADFCYSLLRGNHHVSDATYAAAVDRFGVPATVQIAATLGYFVMWACILNAFEVADAGDLEPTL